MHPEILGALARQHTYERIRHPSPATPFATGHGTGAHAVLHIDDNRPTALRRARRHLGSMLLDVGLHLLVATEARPAGSSCAGRTLRPARPLSGGGGP